MKLYYYLFAFIALTMYSCSSDEEKDQLIGTWQLKEIKTSACENDEGNVDVVLDNNGCLSEKGITACILFSFTFNDDETLELNVSVEIPGLEGLGLEELDLEDAGIVIGELSETSSDATWMNIDGNTIRICDDSECQDINYVLSNDRLTLTMPQEDGDSCQTLLILIKQ